MATNSKTRKAVKADGKAAAKPKKAPKVKMIDLLIPSLDIRYLGLRIVGLEPVVLNRMSEKAKRTIPGGRGKADDGAADVETKKYDTPEEAFKNSMHLWTPIDHKYANATRGFFEVEEERNRQEMAIRRKLMACGMAGRDLKAFRACLPSMAIKNALVDTVDRNQFPGFDKTTFRRNCFVLGYMIELKGGVLRMREDVVRLDNASRAPQMRYRAYVMPWYCDIIFKYRADVIAPKQISAFMEYAGFSNGLGENRPEKSGNSYGQFYVQSAGPVRVSGHEGKRSARSRAA